MQRVKSVLLKINQKFWRKNLSTSKIMANSKYEYVREFESEEYILKNCWAVARIDGRGFHKLATKHNWTRPNDTRALALANKAARLVMKDFVDIIIAYGQSDEYSFVFRREAEVFERRTSKIITTLVSKFSAAYVFHWNQFFPDTKLLYPPSFDGRIVLYPTNKNLRDYLSWRQADCHINNLYNTTFWNLVQKGGLTTTEANDRLSETLSADKNEILFSQFGINYNNEPLLFKKGTVLIAREKKASVKKKKNNKDKEKIAESEENEKNSPKYDEDNLIEDNCDIIGDKFWEEYPHLLGDAE